MLAPRLGGRGRARAALPVTAFQRGRAAFGPLLVTAEFPPGLCSVEMVVELPGSVLVLPRDAVLSRRVTEPLLSGAPRVAATLAVAASVFLAFQQLWHSRSARPESPLVAGLAQAMGTTRFMSST